MILDLFLQNLYCLILASDTIDINDKLKKDSFNGLEKKFKTDQELIKKISNNIKIKEIYKDRLNHEIKIITEMNYSGYFLNCFRLYKVGKR